MYLTQACAEGISALASNFSKGLISSANKRASSCELFPGMKQGKESPLRFTIAAAGRKADGLYRFREGAFSLRMHRPRSAMAKDNGNPLISGILANLGIGPDTSRSIGASDVTKLGGQTSFVRTAPFRLRAFEHPSSARVPPIRYLVTASAGDEGFRVAQPRASEHPMGAARIRSRNGASFVFVLSNYTVRNLGVGRNLIGRFKVGT